jgi:hypothetical protein
MKNAILTTPQKVLRSIDWQLLLFLVLFLNVKLVVKLIAIIFIYIARPGVSFKFNRKDPENPLFYYLVILIACVDLILYQSFRAPHYIVVFLMAVAFWFLCILAMWQIQKSVKRNRTVITHNTLQAFFCINIAASFFRFLLIVADSGAINPYRYQGMYQKYFISTGDLIRGISFDTSTTNAVICAAGVIYFLYRRETIMLLLCMITLLLTGSNITNIILLAVFGYVAIFRGDRVQRSLMLICTMLLIVFMVKVSPQNNNYATSILTKLLGKENKETVTAQGAAGKTDTMEDRKKAFAKHYLDSISHFLADLGAVGQMVTKSGVPDVSLSRDRPEIPHPSIHSVPFQRKRDTLPEQKMLIRYIAQTDSVNMSIKKFPDKYPGKAIAFFQTFSFFRQHPGKIMTGNGAGNFSSKLAFRATALNTNGGYPSRLAYVNEDFKNNHLETFLYFFSRDRELHSVANTPNSVYNQIAGEYGIAGVVAFIACYIMFWTKRFSKKGFGLPLLLLLMLTFFVDYWFEQLSIVVLFELLFFLDIKERNIQQENSSTTWKEKQLLPC